MKKGWYILNYHDIAWEENDFLKGIGGSFPPDLFNEHLEQLSRHGELVSVQEGFERYQAGTIDRPLISIWFDDGLAGVRRHALPLLESYKVTAGMSINSRFLLREELFWRAKLSFLSQVDGLRFLRSKLRKHGYSNSMLVKEFILDRFCDDFIVAIDNVYERFTDAFFREDAFRIFDTVDGIKHLAASGWEIANHSAAHYPVGEDAYIDHFAAQFNECERAMEQHLGMNSRFWVLPFDRKRDDHLINTFTAANAAGRHLVLVGDRVNPPTPRPDHVLYRIYVPDVRGKDLVRKMAGLAFG